MNNNLNKKNSIEIFNKAIERIMNDHPIEITMKNKNQLGYEIEKRLGIDKNELPIADFLGIEIKCVYERSIYPIKLFSSEFDGPNVMEAKVIFDKYHDVKGTKNTFNHSFYGNKNTKLSNSIYGRLFVDKVMKKIHLLFFDIYNCCIENAYWDFDTLYNHVNNKLSILAIIYYKYEYNNDRKYCRITRYKLLKLKDQNTFINLIESGIIAISFSIEKNSNSIHNHGTSFSIKKENITKLFDIQ